MILSEPSMTITPGQLKAAREMIGLSQLALAIQFELTPRMMREFEEGTRTLPVQTLGVLKRAMEFAGVEFLAPT
jgi:DNA-binding transcriptional regulator YiaG